ncbi:MAG: diguanylate cyclase [Phycisphaerae bacterium]
MVNITGKTPIVDADAASGRGGESLAHDRLTGLTSHRAFLDALDLARSDCRRQGQALTLMLVDLDRFRQINATYSRAVGDQVLTWVGRLLKGTCPNADIIARYSWDRFAVAFSHGRQTGDAQTVAQRCLDALLNDSLHTEGYRIKIGASIGVTESGVGFMENAGDLIEQAEQALAAAKRAGGRRVQEFHALSRRAPSRRQLMGASVGDISRWIGLAHQQLRRACVDSTHSLVGAVEAKDPHTRRHSLRVSHLAETLGYRLGLPDSRLETLKTAAMLHDVGKIGVPDAVLRKPGPLTDEEFELIKQHPQTALQILGHASFLDRALPIILHHHERYDGAGYPQGLIGDQIPFGARILAVADSIDAMASTRSYKRRFGVQRIIQELTDCAGRQWDPAVVQAAVNLLQAEPEVIEHDEPMVV